MEDWSIPVTLPSLAFIQCPAEQASPQHVKRVYAERTEALGKVIVSGTFNRPLNYITGLLTGASCGHSPRHMSHPAATFCWNAQWNKLWPTNGAGQTVFYGDRATYRSLKGFSRPQVLCLNLYGFHVLSAIGDQREEPCYWLFYSLGAQAALVRKPAGSQRTTATVLSLPES